MRVIHIERAIHPSYFSIERVSRLIRKELSGRMDIGVYNIPETGFRVRNLVHLFRFQRRQSKDVLYHITGDVHYASLVLPGKRTVLTMHDLNFMHRYRGWRLHLIRLFYLYLPVWKKNTLVAISENTKLEFVNFTGCDPERIKVIPDPVNHMIQHIDREFDQHEPKILFIGSTPNKNLDRVAQALRGIHCRLEIIGRPKDHQKALLKSNGVKTIIRSGLTDEEMAAAYSNADIVLFPSLYEGFGLPVIEGFKAGRAVITSNISPMKDVAKGAACLVDPKDIASIHEGVNLVINNSVYREELIEKAAEVVTLYSPEIIAKRYLDIYEKMMECF